jgi:hypothetical protein
LTVIEADGISHQPVTVDSLQLFGVFPILCRAIEHNLMDDFKPDSDTRSFSLQPKRWII